jgi:hypothetical protein
LNLLLKITELVDKDVEANSKPLSMLGVFIPLLPLIIFTDGPPLDSHPVGAGLAFAAAMAWLGFVVWRMFLNTQKELKPYYRTLGPIRFWALMAGTMAAILIIAAVLTWLEG